MSDYGSSSDGTANIGDTNMKKVTDFKCLGSTISSDGDISLEIRARIKAAWLKWRQVTGFLCDRHMPRRLAVMGAGGGVFARVFTTPPRGSAKSAWGVLGGGGEVLPIIQTPESIFELFSVDFF